jgi:hypothetical protein
MKIIPLTHKKEGVFVSLKPVVEMIGLLDRISKLSKPGSLLMLSKLGCPKLI